MERLVTWLWQGMVLAVGVWGLLRVWRPNASTRFAIWWATLGAVVLLLLKIAAPASVDALPLLPLTLPALPAPLIAVAIGVWLGLSLLGLVDVGVSVSHLRRIKRASRPFPAARERRLPRWLSVRADGRLTRLSLSDHVRSASALGLDGLAIIAINPSLLAEVDDEELDYIILYEYAHLRRHDDWLHVLQLAVQALLTLHPAVSVIGRALRLERDAACDEWVVERTQRPTLYAQCLTKVAAFELSAPNALIAAMGIVGRRGDLTRRIERLLAPRRRVHTRVSALPLASVAVMLVATVIGLSQLPPLVATRRSGEAAAIVAESGRDGEPEPAVSAPAALTPPAMDTLTRAASIIVASEVSEVDETRARPVVSASRVVPQPSTQPRPTLQLASMSSSSSDALDRPPAIAPLPMASSAALVTAAASPIVPRTFEAHATPVASAADEEIDGMPDADGVTGAVGTASKRVWQRAADAGTAVGQRAADAGVNVGQTTSQHAKRAGRAIYSVVKATVSAVR
jgi:beta-lactamase regulating signal transducer with metallopeptidase domain